jgi:hypothetical protein
MLPLAACRLTKKQRLGLPWAESVVGAALHY